ncbi:NSMF [Branchiostoma lanceolatum]|uniref:NSMF protein n=1 Tax=Branchiostoma lanceolatum TaxID=7740 RepID=A0A8K0AE65_BRALA|nr:NSMF [Branchiostoma lanceolatum]
MLSPKARNGDSLRPAIDRSKTTRPRTARSRELSPKSSTLVVREQRRHGPLHPRPKSARAPSPRPGGRSKQTKSKSGLSSGRSSVHLSRRTKMSPVRNISPRSPSPGVAKDRQAVPPQSQSSLACRNLLPNIHTPECSVSSPLPDTESLTALSLGDSKAKERIVSVVQIEVSLESQLISPSIDPEKSGQITPDDAQCLHLENSVQSSVSPRQTSAYCHCCSNGDSLVSLQHRKEKREHREQPWTEDTPEPVDLQWKIGDELQLNIDGFQDDIVSLRWKGEQLEEKAALTAHGFLTPPKVVLISSTVPKSKFLPLTVKEDPSVLVVPYDHQNDSFEKILGDVQNKLTSYCPGCKAKSLLMYMQGGPAHLYLKKNKVTTVAKLKKGGHGDMVCFWKALGNMMSKLEPDTTAIHIMGCNVMGYPKYVGIDLFECLQELMKPSIVRFEAPLEMSIEGNAVIDSYFDTNKYKLWKSQRYSNLDRVFGL